MRTVLFACLGLIVALIAGVLIVPSFFNWNDYKPEIAAEVRAAAGRDLEIGGDISLRLVPSPALVVEDIRLANLPGGVAADMLRVRFARVDVAFWPLLGLELEVRRVHLIDPEIALETLADGRNNWEITAAAAPATVPDATAPGTSDATAPGAGNAAETGQGLLRAIRLDDVAVENATIVYRNQRTGTVETVEALTATISAASLEGPVEAKGSLRFRGLPLGIEIGTGSLTDRTMVPVRLELRDQGEAMRLRLQGHLLDLAQAPRFEGSVRVDGDFLSLAVQRFRPGDLQGLLAQPFVIDGAVEAAGDVAVLDVRELRLGDTTATGLIRAGYAAGPVVDARLTAGRIDLDTWLGMPPARDGGGAAGPPATTGGLGEPGTPGGPAPAGGLPGDLDLRLTLAVEAIAFRGGVVQDARVDARLADGAITVNQVAATLPGGASLAVLGRVTVPGGQPRFDGDVDLRALDLRGTLAWLGVGLDDVAPGRLRTLAAQGRIGADAGRIEARDLSISLDGTRISGGVTAVAGDRPAFGVGLAIDHLNLDDYLPQPAPQRAAGSVGAAPGGAAGGTGDDRGQPVAGATANALAEFDADVRLRAGSLGWRGLTASGVSVEGKLLGGEITVEKASVGDLAGASAAVSGRISGFNAAGGQPLLSGVAFRIDVADPGRLARMFDQPLPPALLALGAVQAVGQIDGTLIAPTVDATVSAAGATLRAAGSAELAATPGFAGQVELTAADLSRLIGGVSGGYRPAGPLGETGLTARVTLAGDRLAVDDLAGALGGVSVSGRLAVDTSRQPAGFTANLATGNLVIDRWLPAKRKAAMPWTLVPVAWSGAHRAPDLRRDGVQPVAVDRRWSREAIDLSALAAVDGDLAWQARTVSHGALVASDVRLTAALARGTLTVPGLDGRVFGGALRASGRLDGSGVPAFDLDLAVDDANLSELAAAGGGGGGLRGGKFSMTTRLTGRGSSEADLIASLGGDGRLAAVGLNPATDVAAVPLVGPILGTVLRVSSLLDNTLGRLLGGGQGGAGLADIRAGFTVDRGVVIYDNLEFQTPLYAGTAAGRADLPAWTIDSRGVARLDETKLAGGLLGGLREVPREIRFEARGPLDDPKAKVDTSGFKAVIEAVPGVESLRKQPGVGEVIDQFLPPAGNGAGGGGGSGTPAKPAVDDLLRGIFR